MPKPARDSVLRQLGSLLKGQAQCSFVDSRGRRCEKTIDLEAFPEAKDHYITHGQALCPRHFNLLVKKGCYCAFRLNNQRCNRWVDFRKNKKAEERYRRGWKVYCPAHWSLIKQVKKQ